MSRLLRDYLKEINLLRRRALWFTVLMRFFRASCMGATIFVLWSAVQPHQEWVAMGLGLLTLILTLAFQVRHEFKPISQADFIVALDMNHPDAQGSPYALTQEALPEDFIHSWRPRLDKEVRDMKAFERRRLFNLVSSLPLPLIALALALFAQPAALSSALKTVSNVVARLNDSATLTVVAGAPGDQYREPLNLSKKAPVELELLMQNMIEVRVVDKPGITPSIDLRRRLPGDEGTDPKKAAYQSFRLAPVRHAGNESRGIYSQSFSVKEDVEVYLSTVSDTKPVAHIKVRQLPIPRVSLEAAVELKTPWPDDKPLPLTISVRAENPLKQVRLVIKAEGRSSTEVVSNVMTNDKKAVTTEYDLILETYVQSDLSRVEIIAEAVDRAIPIPLVGQSEPLFIETASAYGRYRQTLSTLRELKELIDDAVKDNKASLDPRADELADKAMNQSQDSPFFDGLDRVNISSFQANTRSLSQSPNSLRLMELQEDLNEFLYEHETLDDKERDRDFFVAARALSRLAEKPKADRAVKIEVVGERIKSFLEERQKRWQLRVGFLDAPPKSWPKVRQKPFAKAIDQVMSYDSHGTPEGQTQALTHLSKAVTEYRSWIDELEALESRAREQAEKKRQEGLTSARNQLKELQRRQGQVSARLDRAASRKDEDMKDNWPSTRAMQNSNVEGTQGLEAQLRSLSPQASERVKASLEAMKITVESGNADAFAQAESAADMAGRLLRQAQSAAQKSQRQKRRRERRRRVTGDSYYGKQIVGGDVEIKREYAVDRRYREEILDEISTRKQSADSEEEARLLEDYLRRVVR
jgi:hypothetical protein